MVLSLHTDSPLSDLRCCLCFQHSLSCFFSTSRSFSLHYTTLSRFVHTTDSLRFAPFASMRSAPLYSLFLRQCSPVHHVALYPILLCSLQTSRAILLLSLSLSLSRSHFFLSFSVFSLISTLFFLYALFFSFTLPCRSLFFILCFPASQQFF